MNYDPNMVIGSNGNNNISSILNNSDSNSSTSSVPGSNGNLVNELKKLDPKESKQPFPFGLCKVCGDQATGVHYGIATCEGCKVSLRADKFYTYNKIKHCYLIAQIKF